MLIGIDLGTTNSLVACFQNGRAELIPNRLGSVLTPSVVSIDPEGSLYIGEAARERAMLHPLESAAVFKRSMGTEKEFVLGQRHFRAEELSSLILKSLKEDAEAHLGQAVTDAIISVPAYFNDLQRKATKWAGELAGLNVVRIINEPTAAAIAHGMAEKDDARYLVFDLGGGTFDVSILELYSPIMEVHAIAGDNFLGGEDFTTVLCNLFYAHAGIAQETLDAKTRSEVRKTAESCKCAFSHTASIFMICTVNGQTHAMPLTLAQYEQACAPLLEQLRKPVERSLRDANVTLEDIDQIVLVGGATRSPVIRRFVERLFGRKPSLRIDPDVAVALGAALQCAMKERNREIQEVVLTDVCPFTLGTEVVADNGMFEDAGHYLPIIERNTVIPVSRTQTVCTAHENQTKVCVKILQGESRMAANNLLLGELTVSVPAGPKGKEAEDITYTYDVNSLLEVEVFVRSTGLRRRMIIQNSKSRMTDEEARARLEQLQYLKRNPRDEEPNRLILLRGERMYEEATADARAAIDRAMLDFERALKRQDRSEIERARKKLEEFLNDMEFGT